MLSVFALTLKSHLRYILSYPKSLWKWCLLLIYPCVESLLQFLSLFSDTNRTQEHRDTFHYTFFSFFFCEDFLLLQNSNNLFHWSMLAIKMVFVHEILQQDQFYKSNMLVYNPSHFIYQHLTHPKYLCSEATNRMSPFSISQNKSLHTDTECGILAAKYLF